METDLRDLFTDEEIERLECVRRQHCPTCHERVEERCLLFVFGLCGLIWVWALARIALDVGERLLSLAGGLSWL